MKRGMPQGQMVILEDPAPRQKDGQYRGTGEDRGHHGERLGIPPIRPRTAVMKGIEMGRKIECAQGHKYHQNDFDRRRRKRFDRTIARREPAQGHRRQGMTQGIEPCHSGAAQGKQAARGENDVDEPEGFGGLYDPRADLTRLHGPGGLSAVELHPAHAHHRQDGNCHHNDGETANPLQQTAPDMEGLRQPFELREHRCARRRQTGHCLKEHAGGRQVGQQHTKRQRGQ